MATDKERFLEFVDASGECWTWNGRRDRQGYGRFSLNHRQTGAHRASWELHHGPIPEGLFVCHRCDNPPCVNPSHLFLGTNKDNCLDRVNKRRGKCSKPFKSGEQHHRARLTAAKVNEIRAMSKAGHSLSDIARSFGIDVSHVCRITRGKLWAHLLGDDELPYLPNIAPAPNLRDAACRNKIAKSVSQNMTATQCPKCARKGALRTGGTCRWCGFQERQAS